MKPVKCTILAFYTGGAKLQANLAIEPAEVEREMKLSSMANKDAKLETSPEDPGRIEEYLYLTRDGLMFYTISIADNTKKSNLVLAGPPMPSDLGRRA